VTNIFKSQWPCGLRHRFAAAGSNSAEGMGDFSCDAFVVFCR